MKAEQSIHKSVAALVERGFPFTGTTETPWIEGIEAKLGVRLPESFRALVLSYTFPVIELGGVELFANLGDESETDVSFAPFRDRGLFEWLQANRRFQFARPVTASHDPVCLESRGKHSAAVEQVDHEDILLRRKKIRSITLAASLEELLRRAAA